jgi:hypothetical protein
LIEKMESHFVNWQKRNLSLLGKIQIYKTFGLSQFLYHLSVVEPNLANWKLINGKISKFLWNRKMTNNQAPARIKKETLLTPINLGGFGMIEIKEVVTALRLKRHLYLMEHDVHPLHGLLKKLTENMTYLSHAPELEIDEIVNLNIKMLVQKRLRDCRAPDWELESDLTLHTYLLGAKISDCTRLHKRQSNEANQLRLRNIHTVKDMLLAQRQSLKTTLKIAIKDIVPVLTIMARLYNVLPLPEEAVSKKIKDRTGSWRDADKTGSKSLRELLYPRKVINPKTIVLADDTRLSFYSKINKLINVPNKNKMLRFLQGDVYSGERMARFGMTENDRCKRCFDKETIYHLLMECPYTQLVYKILRVNTNDVMDIIGIDLSRAAFEIRCDFLGYLLFRQKAIAPDILVKITLEKFAKGITKSFAIEKEAKKLLEMTSVIN